MARMPDFFAEVEHDLGRLLHHEHHDAPQPAAAPAVPHNETSTQEDHMSFIAEAEADARALAAKLSAVDHDALDALERVQANPETAAAFQLLDQVTRLPAVPGVLTTAIDVLRLTLGQQPSSVASSVLPAPQQPAGPVIAGQA